MTRLVMPTRGDCNAALAGLAHHPPGELVVLAGRPIDAPMLPVLWRMGWDVTVRMQTTPGSYSAVLAQVLDEARDITTVMDDDVVPVGDLWGLAAVLAEQTPTMARLPWVCPVVRFVQGFDEPPRGHTEIWHRVAPDDPAVQHAVEVRGAGWARTFDTGKLLRDTDQLPGAMFAFNPAFVDLDWSTTLRHWSPDVGGADAWLGARLGKGKVLNSVVAYHFGHWSPQKWAQDDYPHRLAKDYPALYSAFAQGPPL